MNRPLSIPALASAFLVALLAVCPAVAKEIAAAIAISERQLQVGDRATLQIQINGTRQFELPAIPEVEGLFIEYVGPQSSERVNIVNGRVERFSGVTLNYRVTAQKEGRFTIPRIEVKAGGETMLTDAVTVTVSGKGAAAAIASEDRIFARYIPSKTEAYVGEVVPVETRILVDSEITWQPRSIPELKGEGFTVQPAENPFQGTTEVGGRLFDTVISRSALTPVKSGTLTLGPGTAQATVIIPERRRRSADPFDDLFRNFGGPLFGGGGEQREIQIPAPAVTIVAKPLPAENRPPEFRSAVGKFFMSAEAAPDSVQPGDPVTLRLRITGEGNFDRVNAPLLVGTSGWRAYDPAQKFEKSDDLGVQGTKTFEFALIPEPGAGPLPEARFAFFDPEKEAYTTLTSGTIPVIVEAGSAPVPSPTPAAEPPQTAQTTPAPKPAPLPSDILHIRSDFPKPGRFVALESDPAFWRWQLAPLLALLAWIAAALLFRANASRNTACAKLRRDWADALRAVESADATKAETFDALLRALRFAAAAKSGRAPETFDGASCLETLAPPAEALSTLRAAIRSAEELRYAGVAAAESLLPPDHRAALAAALRQCAP